MTCGGCSAHICWICLETFDTAGECYVSLSLEVVGCVSKPSETPSSETCANFHTRFQRHLDDAHEGLFPEIAAEYFMARARHRAVQDFLIAYMNLGGQLPPPIDQRIGL